MIYKSLLDLIGNTPIIEYEGVFIKLEQFNLAGSISEVTTGNKGIAIAMICAIKRYKCIIIMPDDVPSCVVSLIKSYGASIFLVSSHQGLEYGIKLAKKLEKEKGYIFLNQFNNIFVIT